MCLVLPFDMLFTNKFLICFLLHLCGLKHSVLSCTCYSQIQVHTPSLREMSTSHSSPQRLRVCEDGASFRVIFYHYGLWPLSGNHVPGSCFRTGTLISVCVSGPGQRSSREGVGESLLTHSTAFFSLAEEETRMATHWFQGWLEKFHGLLFSCILQTGSGENDKRMSHEKTFCWSFCSFCWRLSVFLSWRVLFNQSRNILCICFLFSFTFQREVGRRALQWKQLQAPLLACAA